MISRKTREYVRGLVEVSKRDGLLDEERVKGVMEVLKRERGEKVIGVLEYYLKLMRKVEREETLRVVSSGEMGEGEVEELRRVFEGKYGRKLKVEVRTDKELIAGYTAQVGDDVWDASVVGKLRNLKATMTRK